MQMLAPLASQLNFQFLLGNIDPSDSLSFGRYGGDSKVRARQTGFHAIRNPNSGTHLPARGLDPLLQLNHRLFEYQQKLDDGCVAEVYFMGNIQGDVPEFEFR